ncbi:MAG: EamA family transporter [Planctomycetes bacterium]|nr:EamA family transporter [Planctomycetota bacterium]
MRNVPWQVFALGSAFFAGLTAIFGKQGVAHINSNLATFIRTAIILILIAGVLTWRRGWQRPEAMPTRDVVFLVLSALATGMSWLCYYRALQMAEASRVAPVDKLSVVFAIVLAVLFLGEALTWKVALGGAFVTAGAVIMCL